MNNFHSQHNVKLCGLDNSLDLDEDKVDNKYLQKQVLRMEREQEEMRRKLQHRHLDPMNIECNLPDPPETGAISLDPLDITCNL